LSNILFFSLRAIIFSFYIDAFTGYRIPPWVHLLWQINGSVH